MALWWEGRYVNPWKDANSAEYYEESVLLVCPAHLQESDGGFIFMKMVGTSDLGLWVIRMGLRQDRSPEFRRKKE